MPMVHDLVVDCVGFGVGDDVGDDWLIIQHLEIGGLMRSPRVC